MDRFFGNHPVMHAGMRDAAALALVAPILLIGHVDHHPGLGCVVEAMRSFLLAFALVLPVSLAFHAWKRPPAEAAAAPVNRPESSPAR